ncbi:MAG TPA: hypothetical protein VF378_06315 [Geothrix sp.]
MAVPLLLLNLAPRPSLWRQQHPLLGWAALGLGTAFLLGTLSFTWRAYHQANRAGRDAVSLTEETKRAARQEQRIKASLQDMDATREQARWKLAERILQERSLPWSRLTAELEQCMVPDMRLKALQRVRSSGQQVVMKIKGEARTRQAEAAFVDALRSTPVFAQVVLEREAERTGGGWDFEISLPAAAVPPPFQVKVMKPAAQAAQPTRVAVQAPSAATQARVPAPSATPLPQPGPPQHLVGPAGIPPHPVTQDGEEGDGRRPNRRTRPAPRDPRNPQ